MPAKEAETHFSEVKKNVRTTVNFRQEQVLHKHLYTCWFETQAGITYGMRMPMRIQNETTPFNLPVVQSEESAL